VGARVGQRTGASAGSRGADYAGSIGGRVLLLAELASDPVAAADLAAAISPGSEMPRILPA
jgi:hypothetical protein